MWQAETEAADAQRQLASVRDASRMAEQKVQETHTKAVEDLQQQLTAQQVWWHCLFYSRGVVVWPVRAVWILRGESAGHCGGNQLDVVSSSATM